ncbi:hypothetical protein ACQ86N_02815 [Puia sp. P3]|uniref:hypothetical protein n=1 Tax=Puia sp. P3 TaxID=3423952 RepID=UPI003D675619
MDKTAFLQRLTADSKLTVDLTKSFCMNQFPDTHLYTIVPNSWMIDLNDEHLTKDEIFNLQSWRLHKGRALAANDVAELMIHDYKIPAWMNLSVWKITKDHTIFEIFCSRRLREEPPEVFHIQVALPPYYEKGVQFDVNWRSATGKE